MHAIQRLIFDIDGTISDDGYSIDPALKDLLQQCRQKGIDYVLASGRPYHDLMAFKQNNDLDCECVMMNGAACIDREGNVYASLPLQALTNREILLYLHQNKIPTSLFQETKGYHIRSDETSFIDVVLKMYGEDDTSSYIASMQECFLEEALSLSSVLKIESIVENRKRMQDLSKQLMRWPGICVSSSMGWNVEITSQKANKGEALLALMKRQGIQPEQCLVFGDGDNDIAMFQRFPNSVLVENENQRLIPWTKYHVKSCRKHGVTHFLQMYFKGS